MSVVAFWYADGWQNLTQVQTERVQNRMLEQRKSRRFQPHRDLIVLFSERDILAQSKRWFFVTFMGFAERV